MNRKLSKKETPNIMEPAGGFPVVRNVFRKRLDPVFKLPYPLNGLLFRLVVQRFLPWMGAAGIIPLRVVEEESVCGSDDSRFFRSKWSPGQRIAAAVQAASETGLLFHLPHGKTRRLERIDVQFLGNFDGSFVARAEWSARECVLLLEPNGRILKGIAVVNAQNELVAKAVTEWSWK